MKDIIRLLTERNTYLRKFMDLNEKEFTRLSEGLYENIEVFYETRERILDIVKYLDQLISEFEQDPAQIIARSSRMRILELLDEKEELVTEILNQDLQIISLIEREKSKVIQTLQTIGHGRRVISAYRSGP